MNAIQWFKCLADPTRLFATLLISSKGELCVCDLVCALEESQPKISRHLAQLRICNILTDRRDGQWVFYSLHPALPSWALESLKLIQTAEQPQLAPMLRRLQKNAVRAC